MRFTLSGLCLGLLFSFPAIAQKTGRDCQDPVSISRPADFRLASCQNNYGTYRFRIKPGQEAQPVMGNAITYQYVLEGKTAKSQTAVADLMKHYEEQIRSQDGRVIYTDTAEGSFSMIRAGMEYWLHLSAFKATGVKGGVQAYSLVVMEKKVPQIKGQPAGAVRRR